jgi:K+-sensing histidine kinase KdpD
MRQRIIERGERGVVDGEGFGLGLSIVGDVLAEYGLRPHIADVDGGGCSVSFVLRTRPGAAQAEAKAKRSWAAPPAGPA